MAKLTTYANDSNITDSDKLLGTDTSGETKNFTLADIKSYVNAEAGISYKHHQNNASNTWTITHNLDLSDYLPHVNIKLSGGGTYNNVQAMGVVTYVTKDQLTISLADAHSGYAYILK
jgi:hypothetical protein